MGLVGGGVSRDSIELDRRVQQLTSVVVIVDGWTVSASVKGKLCYSIKRRNLNHTIYTDECQCGCLFVLVVVVIIS